MKTIWKSLCRRLLPLLLLGLLLCFCPSAQAQGDSNQDWPPERLLQRHDPRHPENTILDWEHSIVTYRADRSEITDGASWSRVPGRDSFDPPNFYPTTDPTQSLSVSETYLGSRGVEYRYFPASSPGRNCLASMSVSMGGYGIDNGVIEIRLAGLDGFLQSQTTADWSSPWIHLFSVEGTTPYAKQVVFAGYRMELGNIFTTIEDIYQF